MGTTPPSSCRLPQGTKAASQPDAAHPARKERRPPAMAAFSLWRKGKCSVADSDHFKAAGDDGGAGTGVVGRSRGTRAEIRSDQVDVRAVGVHGHRARAPFGGQGWRKGVFARTSLVQNPQRAAAAVGAEGDSGTLSIVH